MPIGDRRVVLLWRKRLWRCPDPDCPVKTWSEDTDAIAPRAVLTERARAEIPRGRLIDSIRWLVKARERRIDG